MALTVIGRFKVGKKLGSGNQGSVYLCGDPKLQRRVAIKLLDKASLGSDGTDTAFLTEARAISRIQHPNIVTIYEAGKHQGIPFLVFEYVEGRLLSEVIASGERDLGQLLEVFQGMLEGMARAHSQGIVHRDLKPANVIISVEGIPKIMDFGIARVLKGNVEQDTQLIGSPRYMAPEYIDQGRVGTQADVFALGLILDEMLTGMPVFKGRSHTAVMNAILNDPVPTPSTFNDKVDERLDRMVLKALEKDPGARFSDAGDFLQAVRAYRESRKGGGAMAQPGRGTIEFLLRRMQRKSDFPALAQSVRTLNAMASTSDRNVNDMAQVIVKDFALTNKILKVVNSAYYGHFAGKIGTVSRAVVVLGMQPIRSLAASLIFFDHLHDKTQAEELKTQTVASLYSAVLAGSLAAELEPRRCEDHFLSAMLHDLGRILVTFYLPDESREIARLEQQGIAPLQAQRQVLGTTFEEVGVGIAEHWNFPESVVRTLRHLPAEGELKSPRSLEERRQVVAEFAHELTRQIGAGAVDDRVSRKALLDRYGDILALDDKKLSALVQTASKAFADLTKNLESRGKENDFVKRLKGEGVEMVPFAPVAPAAAGELAATAEHSPATGEAVERVLENVPAQTADSETLLTEGLQEVTNILLNHPALPELCNVVLETMYRAMAFERIVLCLRDGTGRQMSAKLGFGNDVDRFRRGFQFPLAWRKDVFHVVLKNSVDVYISDTTDPKMKQDLPDWYKRLSDAGCFVLFPLVVKQRPLGLIYGDHLQVEGLQINGKTLNLLKTLRNQIVLGIRERM